MLRVKLRGTLGHSSFTEGRTQGASLWPEARLKGAHRELARPEVASTTLKKACLFPQQTALEKEHDFAWGIALLNTMNAIPEAENLAQFCQRKTF